MWCPDPLLESLKQYGYNIIRLPRSGIRPLQILTRTGTDLDRLGDLTTIMLTGPVVPAMSQEVATNIAGGIARTGSIDAKLGIPILSNAIAAMGGSRIGLEARYEGAKSVTFEFLEVKEEAIEVARLDQYLAQAKPNPKNRQITKLLTADAVYVITSVLKSSKLNIAAKSSRNQALKLDAGELAKLVGADGKVNVSAVDSSSSTIQYAGAVELAFGFQAVQLQFVDGKYDGFQRLRPEAAAMRGIGPDDRAAAPAEQPAPKAPDCVMIGGADAPFVTIRDARGDRATAHAQTRRALLIGIDRYPKLDERFQLNGCVRDVEVMAGTLEETFGFAKKNIRILKETEDTTRDAILTALDDLVRQTEAEDVVLLQYSGHGSQVRDREGDEPDGWDETIVPSDSGRGKDPCRDITDDEIYARLLPLSVKTANITLLFDSCHSGTITRDAFGSRGRRLDPDPRPASELPPVSIPAGVILALKAAHKTRDLGPSGLFPLAGSYVLIAGCRDEETSFEHTVYSDAKPVTHGALTYFFHQALLSAQPGATYRDIFDLASTRVTACYSAQHPQLEGAADRVVFGATMQTPEHFVAVKPANSKSVTLAAGAAHGLTVGSIWAIYPPGTRRADPKRVLVRATIDRVDATTSVAMIKSKQAPTIPAGARATEEEHDFGGLRLVVELVDQTGDSSAVRDIRARLDDSKLLRVADKEAGVRVYLLPAGNAKDRRGVVPTLGKLTAATWAIVGGDGQVLTPTGTIGQEDSHARLVSNLETIARYRNARDIVNSDRGNVLQGKVDLILLRKNAQGDWVPARPNRDNQVVFIAGEQMGIRIINRHTEPIYPTVLDLGLTFQIAQIYPTANSQPALGAGIPFDYGTRSGEEMDLIVPDEYTLESGVETFKLFATCEPADFRLLEQSAVRALRGKDGKSRSPLESLMDQALGNTRDAKKRTLPSTSAWTTVERSMILMAKAPKQAAPKAKKKARPLARPK